MARVLGLEPRIGTNRVTGMRTSTPRFTTATTASVQLRPMYNPRDNWGRRFPVQRGGGGWTRTRRQNP